MKIKFFQSTATARDLPGLGALTESERARVIERGRVVHIPGGWTPIRRHEPADEAYLVLEGVLRVDSDEEHVADIGPGGFAGEMGLVDHKLRNARVTTVGDVVALAFPRSDFQSLRRELKAFDDVVTQSSKRRHAEGQ